MGIKQDIINMELAYRRNLEMLNTAHNALAKVLKSAEDYKPEIERAKREQAIAEYQEKVQREYDIFSERMTSAMTNIRAYIQSKFTPDISADDLANFQLLESLNLSQKEIEIQYEKYAGNQLALRRLKDIGEKKGYGVSKEFLHLFENIKDYDYYMNVVEDYKNAVMTGFKASNSRDIEKPRSEFDDSKDEVYLKLVLTNREKLEKEIETLEK